MWRVALGLSGSERAGGSERGRSALERERERRGGGGKRGEPCFTADVGDEIDRRVLFGPNRQGGDVAPWAWGPPASVEQRGREAKRLGGSPGRPRQACLEGRVRGHLRHRENHPQGRARFSFLLRGHSKGYSHFSLPLCWPHPVRARGSGVVRGNRGSLSLGSRDSQKRGVGGNDLKST